MNKLPENGFTLVEMVAALTELARLAADVFAAIFPGSQSDRTHLVEHEGTLVQQLCL